MVAEEVAQLKYNWRIKTHYKLEKKPVFFCNKEGDNNTCVFSFLAVASVSGKHTVP